MYGNSNAILDGPYGPSVISALGARGQYSHTQIAVNGNSATFTSVGGPTPPLALLAAGVHPIDLVDGGSPSGCSAGNSSGSRKKVFFPIDSKHTDDNNIIHRSRPGMGPGGVSMTVETDSQGREIVTHYGDFPATKNPGPRKVPATNNGDSRCEPLFGSRRGCSAQACSIPIQPQPIPIQPQPTSMPSAPSNGSNQSTIPARIGICGSSKSGEIRNITAYIGRAILAGKMGGNKFGLPFYKAHLVGSEQIRSAMILVAHGDDCNELLLWCRQTGFQGMLLLLGAATRGVLKYIIPSTVQGVVLTHANADGTLVDDTTLQSIVGNVPHWLYCAADRQDNPRSLLDPENPRIVELVRALRLGLDQRFVERYDWRQLLTDTFKDDRVVDTNPVIPSSN